jgi:hypothetical protein
MGAKYFRRDLKMEALPAFSKYFKKIGRDEELPAPAYELKMRSLPSSESA